MVSMNKTSDPACKAKLRSEAVASFQRGLTVTPEVEKHAIAAMRRLGVTVIVAPYEADSQLAYLCAIGMCEAVLTEDSDIIVYSAICKTNFPILYKFSTNGIAQMIECSRVFKPHRSPLNPDGTESTGRRSKFLASLRDYLGPSGRRMFVQMCVLAGCDYNESVPGVGLQYAQQVTRVAVICLVMDHAPDSLCCHLCCRPWRSLRTCRTTSGCSASWNTGRAAGSASQVGSSSGPSGRSHCSSTTSYTIHAPRKLFTLPPLTWREGWTACPHWCLPGPSPRWAQTRSCCDRA